MDEKGSMSAAFELTPELRDLLGLRDAEYVVKNPVEIVVEATDGSRLKPPQEIRERVVRCRDCAYSEPCPLVGTEKLVCNFLDEMLVNPDGFCAWGFPRNGGE